MEGLGNKLLLPRDATRLPVLAHVIRESTLDDAEVVVAYQDAEVRQIITPFVSPNVRWLKDAVSWRGPLFAIAHALRECDGEQSYASFQVVAGDLPGLTTSIVQTIWTRLSIGTADVVTYVRDGREQPLLAAYRWHVARTIIDAVANGETRILRLFEHLRVDRVEIERDIAWRIEPVHTPEDYRIWETRGRTRETP